MSLKERLFSNMFLRNMLADFGNRSAYSTSSTRIVPYFQYKIGKYQPDYYLYFPRQPYLLQYKNEVVNKLCEYSGYDAIQYLEFHYYNFEHKTEFLRFLQYELSERLKRGNKKNRQIKLQVGLEWITEKQTELQANQEKRLKQEIEQDIRTALTNQPESNLDIEGIIQTLSDKFSHRIEALMTGAEEKLETLTSSFTTGNIELNNRAYLEKLIQLHILILQLKAPGKGEQLFKRYSVTDLAFILNLHYEAFKNKKPNTVQVEIKKCYDTINYKSPKWQQLEKALNEFIYD